MDLEAVRQAFAATKHCVLATASPDGFPWLSTVFFNYDSAYTIIWESTRLSRHSQLIDKNRLVSLYIANDDHIAGALYGTGVAQEVTGPVLEHALDTFLNGPHQRDDPHRTVDDYAPGGPIGLYAVTLDRLYALRQTKLDGYTVEEREDVDLAALTGS